MYLFMWEGDGASHVYLFITFHRHLYLDGSLCQGHYMSPIPGSKKMRIVRSLPCNKHKVTGDIIRCIFWAGMHLNHLTDICGSASWRKTFLLNERIHYCLPLTMRFDTKQWPTYVNHGGISFSMRELKPTTIHSSYEINLHQTCSSVLTTTTTPCLHPLISLSNKKHVYKS